MNPTLAATLPPPQPVDGLEAGDGTLSDRVYRHLAERLVSGRLAPGDKLSLRAVAETLGVSMMPVREAVTRLAAENALIVEPKRAVAVPLMRIDGFRDLTRVRIAIEGTAAAMAARNADADAKSEIARTEAAFRLLSTQRTVDLPEAVSANQAFHFALYRAAGSNELIAIIERLWLKAGPIINFDLRESPERLRIGGAVRYHAAILAAVIAGDAASAEAALASDIRGAADFILSQNRFPQ